MIGGSLHYCLNEWKNITDNKTVLNWLTQGVPLDFIREPDIFENYNNIFSSKESAFLNLV